MCGLIGVYNKDNKPVDLDSLKSLNQVIKHRGPDSSGLVLLSETDQNCKPIEFSGKYEGDKKSKIFDGYNIGFAHQRLSIIDLSNKGHQPMSDLDKDIWIIFNGEIYNHKEIRVELEQKGFTFRSKTDTEVIIYAYKFWGIEFIKRLKGVFAFALWDQKEKTLFIVRDRIGVKPLYYTTVGDSFYFSSEIKALIKIPNTHPTLNHEVLSYYFSFLAIPAPNTLFKDIYKVEPGTFLKIKKSEEPKIVKYWDSLENYQNTCKSEDYYINQTELLLEEAIKGRMMSDVPTGVFLSGGVDSSLIVAMMSKISKQPINTLTIGYKGLEKSNEFIFAKEISEIYKTNHHELIIDVQDTETLIHEMIYYQDEPIADPVCIPVLLLARKAKELGISVIQVGEGADEVFAGYKNLKTYLKINKIVWRYSSQIPVFLKKLIGFCGKMALSKSKYRKYVDYFDFFVENKELYWSNTHKFYPSDLNLLLIKNYQNPYNFIASKLEKYRASGNRDFLSKTAYQELNLRLPELLLMRVDKMTMATGVEGRVPFLDHELVEFGLSIPDNLKVKNKHLKFIIKKIAEKYLPHHIIYREKAGFGFPIKEFFTGDFKDFLYKSIFESGLRKEGIINYDFVSEMFKLSESKKVNYHSQIWSIANLSLWYDLWFSEEH